MRTIGALTTLALCAMLSARLGGAETAPPVGAWTDAATGRVQLVFAGGGEGALDGRRFAWTERDGTVTLRFYPDSPLGRTVTLRLLPGGGPHLRSQEGAFIPGIAVSEDGAAEALGAEIAEYARQFEGGSYRYGGADPDGGFDCSGLVQYVYGQFGYALDRIASAQAKNGEPVEHEDMRAGDVICFRSGTYIGHVGIYLGDNKFIHAECSATGVVISELADYYEQRGYEVRRIAGSGEERT